MGEDLTKLEMVVKVKRGDKEEKLKVEVHHLSHGTFHLDRLDAKMCWNTWKIVYTPLCLKILKTENS